MGEGQNTSGNAPNDEESIGVALSGGGIRATLFSLGALMYFVDSGYSRYVTDISSVSRSAWRSSILVFGGTKGGCGKRRALSSTLLQSHWLQAKRVGW
jgi:hypothetical protein